MSEEPKPKIKMIVVGYYLKVPVILEITEQTNYKRLLVKLNNEWLSCDDLQSVFYAINDYYDDLYKANP